MKWLNVCILAVIMAATGLVFVDCQPPESSASVDQDRIYVIYELFYNKNTDLTKPRATFRFGNALGTPLYLATGSEVSFEGELMSKITDQITVYEKDLAGKKDSGTFKWIDTEAKEFFNSIKLVEIEHQDSITIIPRNAAYELFWKGTPLGDGEKINLLVAVGNSSQLFTTNDKGSQSIILNKLQLEKLPAGTATLYLDRIYETALQQATSAGGTIFSRYRPTNITVELK